MYGVRKGSGVLLWHLETRLSIIKNSWGARAVCHPVLGGIRESKRPGGGYVVCGRNPGPRWVRKAQLGRPSQSREQEEGQRLQLGPGRHFPAEGASELSFGGWPGFSLGILS